MSWVYFCGALPDDATKILVTHSLRLQPSIIRIPLVTYFAMKARVIFETTIEPHDLAYYSRLKPRSSQAKGKSLTIKTTVVSFISEEIFWPHALHPLEMGALNWWKSLSDFNISLAWILFLFLTVYFQIYFLLIYADLMVFVWWSSITPPSLISTNNSLLFLCFLLINNLSYINLCFNFSYFSQTIHLLDSDSSIYCISAWNDQVCILL